MESWEGWSRQISFFFLKVWGKCFLYTLLESSSELYALCVCVSTQSKFRRAAGSARPADGVWDELAGSAREDVAFPACSANRQVPKRRQWWFSGSRPVALNTDHPWVESLRRSRPAQGKQHGCQNLLNFKKAVFAEYISFSPCWVFLFFCSRTVKRFCFPEESVKGTQVSCGKGNTNGVHQPRHCGL